MMDVAVEDGLLAKSPVTKKVRKSLPSIPKNSLRAERILTIQELERLANTIDPRYRCAVLVMGYLGLRFGEMAGLQREDVDLERGVVSVNWGLEDDNGSLMLKEPKSESSRRKLEIPGPLHEDLAEHMGTVGIRKHVFADTRGGWIRYGNWRRDFFDPAVESAGLVPLTPHDLRHTSVAMLIDQGAHPRDIQDWAGHARYQMTMDVYGHLFPGRRYVHTTKMGKEILKARARAGEGV